jgi:phage head maturation protease
MHRQVQAIGTGAELGLQIWSDTYGLAFAFKPPSTAWSLVCGVAEGRYDQTSAGFRIDAATTERQGSVVFDDISCASLDEISICPRGACPGALCWHIGNGPRALLPQAAALLPGWEVGRSAARQSMA